MRQEAGTRTGQSSRQEGPRGGERQVVLSGQEVAEEEERQGADAHHAGGQAVEAVDEVDGVDGGDHHDHAEQRRLGRGQHELVGLHPRQLRKEVELDTEEHQERRRQHLPAELGQGVDVEDVVQHPHRADQGAREEHDAHIAEDEAVAAREERQLPADEVGRSQSTEHGDATEIGNGLGVHVAVADLRDSAGPQSDLARDHRQEVGDRAGDQEDE